MEKSLIYFLNLNLKERSLEHSGVETSDKESVDGRVTEAIDSLIVVVIEQRFLMVFEFHVLLNNLHCLGSVVDVLVLNLSGAPVEDFGCLRRSISVDYTDPGHGCSLYVFCFLMRRIDIPQVTVLGPFLIGDLSGNDRSLIHIWKVNLQKHEACHLSIGL